MEPSPFLWRRLQAALHLITLTLPLFVANALLLAGAFQGVLGPSAWVWVATVVVTSGGWAFLAWFLRDPVGPTALRVTQVLLVLGSVAVALECAWFVDAVFPSAGPEGRLALGAAVTLLMATGSLVLSAVPTASAAWIAGMVVGILGAVGGDARWDSPPAWFLAVSLVVVLVVLVVTSHRQYLTRLRAEAQASSQTQLVGLLLHDFGEGSLDWVWETDAQGRLRSVSPRLARQFARPASELEGRSLVEVLVDDPTQLTVEDEDELAVLAGKLTVFQLFHDVEVPAQSAGPQRRWKVSARPTFDDLGRPSGWLGVGTDITEAERIHSLNRRLAVIDSLTGLINRHRFQAVLHDYLSPRSADRPLGLILIDLKNFRMVNEGLGHEVGDKVLKEVASRLRPRVPTTAELARLGGDEFALLVRGAGDEDLERLAAELRSASLEPFEVEGHRLEVTFQIGIAASPRDTRGAVELLKCAELALHAAKLSPRGTTVTYRPEFGTQAHDRIRLHAELKTALYEGQFELHFQPQIRVADGALVGSEALVRWRHPQRGLVPPIQFIPALEETGLIVAVGRWILEAACREALTWPVDEKVAVNVSAVQFASRTFLESVQRILAATGFPAQRLELEITESVMAQDPAEVIASLRELRALGISISLDDFGTGYSSLSYLRQMPLDKLKVDQSFVRAMDHDANAGSIVQAVLDLSRALGLQTTAEGVETEDQRARLAMLGVDNIQGYLYSKPVPPDGLRKFRDDRRG